MSGFLDANQIEKLFEQASEGNLPVEVDAASGRRARWLRTVDFTRPTKFSTDQERRIRRALDTFSERAATRLVAEHRTGLEMEVIDVGQFTWTNAYATVPEHSVLIPIQVGPHDGKLLLTAELPMVLVALEMMLGGRPDSASRERQLTDIDLILAQRLFSTLVESLSAVFYDIAEMTLTLASVETQSEMVQIAVGSEPTLSLTLEARLEGLSSTMTLLIPYATIAPVAAAFSRREDDTALRRDADSAAAVQQGLSLVDVTLRAEVADTTLSLQDVLELKPGDVVRLDAEADAEVTLFADRTPVHRARAGRSGQRRAVQITAPVETES
jgi:flagellar motor switch protein FliM